MSISTNCSLRYCTVTVRIIFTFMYSTVRIVLEGSLMSYTALSSGVLSCTEFWSTCIYSLDFMLMKYITVLYCTDFAVTCIFDVN